jgi:hypothetical protein
MPKERQTTVPPKKDMKVIYSEPSISEEAKEAFLEAYNELELNYLRLKQSLSQYIVNSKKTSKLN